MSPKAPALGKCSDGSGPVSVSGQPWVCVGGEGCSGDAGRCRCFEAPGFCFQERGVPYAEKHFPSPIVSDSASSAVPGLPIFFSRGKISKVPGSEDTDLSVIPCILSDVNIPGHSRQLGRRGDLFRECRVSEQLGQGLRQHLSAPNRQAASEQNLDGKSPFPYRRSCSECCLRETIRA